MERDFETVMIEQCAPVLAGLKPANLFRHETRDEGELQEKVALWNERFASKGLQMTILKRCARTNRYLIYLYREKKLACILSDRPVQNFLREQGYFFAHSAGEAGRQETACTPLLEQLSHRLCCEGEFPHEIGVFLGYPLCDVVGFIENRGQNFTCAGCWKSYSEPIAAKKYFDMLNKCTAVYLRCFHSGTPITRLAVAV